MVDGLSAKDGQSGKMATEIAHAIDRSKDMELVPLSMTGPDTENDIITINDLPVKLFKPNEKDALLLEIAKEKIDVSCNFTLPSAINEIVLFYAMNQMPFVNGTTGGDMEYMTKLVINCGIYAVITSNTAREVVAFQMMMKKMSKEFPLLFKDYSLQITESHQKNKVDVSGTAEAMVPIFNKLGLEFETDQIIKKRSDEDYDQLNIPIEHWGGHSYNTYSLVKKDKSVMFEFTHNINGRQAYVDGTLEAIRFLHKKEMHKESGKLSFSTFGKVYSMYDVLKG
jgi:4-hydroxy-tetrahydrodipicolinate reductase